MPESPGQLKRALGLVIQRLAGAKRLSQSGLAKAMHRKPGVVGQWWHGKVMPDTESLLALARIFDTTHAALMEAAQRLLRDETAEPGLATAHSAIAADLVWLDPDARQLGDHLAQELTHELRNYPQRRAELLKHWYGQIQVTRWPANLPAPPLPPEALTDDAIRRAIEETEDLAKKLVPITRPIELAKARTARRRPRRRKNA
jgi:transcriptional regulator with XRE-family HTH domain